MTPRPSPRRDPGALREQLSRDAERGGYHLNPDVEFTTALAEGLLANEARYGYAACPCRLASGDVDDDRDIVCPCDYRDADLLEWGACYCGLYVADDVLSGRRPVGSIPERRPRRGERRASPREDGSVRLQGGCFPVWRCRVCGYLCARERPPGVCPICRATQDRFEPFA
ncbi:MAG: ferredoxin-thioredoxin reductase catalytic domain-containing protein [Candidatus Bipolaricaulota bacterium]